MNSVKVNRKELLDIVSKNKEKHIKEYADSVADYKVAAIKLAESNLVLAQSGEISNITKMKVIPTSPISYEQNYNRAIRMLELSVDKVIDLEESVFNQLVLDEWSWKNAFVASASLYKSM